MPKKFRRAERRHDHLVAVTSVGGPHRGADPRVMRRRATKMLAALELDPVELSVALVDDATIRGLNRDYRGMDKATDVLAFEMDAEPQSDDERCTLGDVVISVPTARRQANKRRKALLHELTFLLGHGLLHLLGHDHQDDASEHDMNARTHALVAAAERRSG